MATTPAVRKTLLEQTPYRELQTMAKAAGIRANASKIDIIRALELQEAGKENTANPKQAQHSAAKQCSDVPSSEAPETLSVQRLALAPCRTPDALIADTPPESVYSIGVPGLGASVDFDEQDFGDDGKELDSAISSLADELSAVCLAPLKGLPTPCGKHTRFGSAGDSSAGAHTRFLESD